MSDSSSTASYPTILRADWLATMDGIPSPPPIRDGAILVESGTVIAAGPANEVRRLAPSADFHDCGSVVLLPGLVNAHVHLELSGIRAGARPAQFVDWVIGLFGQMPDPRSPGFKNEIDEAIRVGVAQCLQFGVTTVGDISRHSGLTRALLREGPLRVVSYGEVTAMAQRRELLEDRLASAASEEQAGTRLQVGISPHAPYSVEPHGYGRCVELSEQRRLPLATHLAETPDEAAFLREHAGPLRELWSFLNAWDERVPFFDGGPLRLMQSIGLLDRPAVLAHVNYCDDAELALLAGGRSSVVYCPRTHAFFGHPPHRWREMLAAGVNVAVGTDSTASSPDLNLVDDLRLLLKLAPDIPAVTLWEMATSRPALAMGLQNEVGTLALGKAADVVAFAVETANPLREVLETERQPSDVWVGGERDTKPR